MKRIFIGIPITCENAVAIVNNWKTIHYLNSNCLIWTKPFNWHITLVFLGAYPESVISLLKLIINEAFNDSYSYNSQLSGVGVFPDKRRPNVLWIGLKSIQPLQGSYEKLNDLLKKNNYLFDQKPLKPHLTVARIKYLYNPIYLKELLDKYKLYNFGQVTIDRIILYESISTVNGVIYSPLYVKNLDISN